MQPDTRLAPSRLAPLNRNSRRFPPARNPSGSTSAKARLPSRAAAEPSGPASIPSGTTTATAADAPNPNPVRHHGTRTPIPPTADGAACTSAAPAPHNSNSRPTSPTAVKTCSAAIETRRQAAVSERQSTEIAASNLPSPKKDPPRRVFLHHSSLHQLQPPPLLTSNEETLSSATYDRTDRRATDLTGSTDSNSVSRSHRTPDNEVRQKPSMPLPSRLELVCRRLRQDRRRTLRIAGFTARAARDYRTSPALPKSRSHRCPRLPAHSKRLKLHARFQNRRCIPRSQLSVGPHICR